MAGHGTAWPGVVWLGKSTQGEDFMNTLDYDLSAMGYMRVRKAGSPNFALYETKYIDWSAPVRDDISWDELVALVKLAQS